MRAVLTILAAFVAVLVWIASWLLLSALPLVVAIVLGITILRSCGA